MTVSKGKHHDFKKRSVSCYHMDMNEEIIYQILGVVSEIPYGKVTTYGQIACLIGKDKNARLVGKTLRMSHLYGSFPCHRVVNAQGKLAPNFTNQRDLLLEENIPFKKNGNVDLKKCQWKTNH